MSQHENRQYGIGVMMLVVRSVIAAADSSTDNVSSILCEVVTGESAILVKMKPVNKGMHSPLDGYNYHAHVSVKETSGFSDKVFLVQLTEIGGNGNVASFQGSVTGPITIIESAHLDLVEKNSDGITIATFSYF